MRFSILGPVTLCAGQRTLSAGGPGQVALLAYLLLHANRAVTQDEIHDALWSQRSCEGARKRTHVAIARLRKGLEPLQPPQDGLPVLRTVNGGYLLVCADGELDAQVFQDAVTAGHAALDAGDPVGASELLRSALGMWRGPALADVAFRDFAQPEIRRLHELQMMAFEGRIEADIALGRHEAVIGELEALTAEHPERERLTAQLMLALYRGGRQARALEAYQRLRRHLRDEHGLHPGPPLQTLQRAVLEQASWLELDSNAAPVRRRRMSHPDERRGATAAEGRFALPATLRTEEGRCFVGREDALEKLQGLYGCAAAGARQMVLLRGEPGVGKTRLAAEFAALARADGAVVLSGRCDAESLLPYQPFVEALRHYVNNCPASLLAEQVRAVSGELRRVVPELADRVPELAEPVTGDPEGARHRLFEAVAALLCEAAQQRPLVLVLDDLHWADKATLLLLKYLARYPREARMMVVGAYRETDVETGDPLADVLTDLARESVCERLSLERLDETAVVRLVGWHTGNRASPELCRLVYEETDGLAFFVVEVMRHLEDGDLPQVRREPDDGGLRVPVSERMRDLVLRRLARLGPDATGVLRTASVLGREFRFEMLDRLCDLTQDELVDCLDRAVRAKLVDESVTTAGRYAFSHPLIRDVLYGMLSLTRRALMHRRVATTIEHAHAAHLEAHLEELAHHFGHAGSAADLRKAVAYGIRAGERALSLLAYEQAAAHYRQAIERLGTEGTSEQLCELLIARGQAERMAGDRAHRETFLQAASLARRTGDVARLAQAALANSRGFNSSSQGVDHERVAVLEAALEALDDSDSPTRAELLAQLAIELIADSDWQSRSRMADDALRMARRVGDRRTLARVLTQRAVAQWRPVTLESRIAGLQEALRLADDLGERMLAVHAAHWSFHTLLEAGDIVLADRHLKRLGALARELGQPGVDWYEAVARAKRCGIVGAPADQERLAFAAHAVGERAGQPDAVVWLLGQLFASRFLASTLDCGEPHLPALFSVPGSAPATGAEFTQGRSIPLMVAAAMSAIYCEIGRLAEARAHFRPLMTRTRDLPNDYSTLGILAPAAVACARLRDAGAAGRLHALLEPHADQYVNTGAAWFGGVGHHLALLLATMGRFGDADRRFADAAGAYEDLAALPWLARCRLDWATSLLDRPDPDVCRAHALIDRAVDTARGLGLIVLEQRAHALRRPTAGSAA